MKKDENKRHEKNDSLQDEAFSESFFEDDIDYPAFEEGAEPQIIIPIEFDRKDAPINLPDSNKEASEPPKEKKRHESLNERLGKILTFIPGFIEKTGETTINCAVSFFKKVIPFVFAPFVFLFSHVVRIIKVIFGFFKNTPREFANEIKSIGYEIKIIRKQAAKDEKSSFFSAMKKYFVISFSRHKVFWKSLFNGVFPIAAALVLIFTLSAQRGKITALEVTYNGQKVGYVENESVFEKGKSLASSMLEQSDEKSVEKSEPIYKLKKVSPGRLSSEKMICESIVSQSDDSLSRACGVYVDGEFLCAVSNETDASAVFDSILAPYKSKSSKSDIVAFVEQIAYKQGLYSQEDVWDSLKLQKQLSQKQKEKKYYKAKKDDSAKLIAKKFSLTVKQLKTLNPGIDFSKLKKGQSVLVQAEESFVRVKVMKTRTTTQTLKFETEKKQSSSLAKGTTKTVREGTNGKTVTTELVTYIDGIETYSTVVSQKQTVSPINKIVYVGTKTQSGSSSSSSQSSSSDSGSYSYSSSSGFIWPTRGAYGISSGFGYRSASISGWSYHGGLDIVKPGGGSTGTPVVASAAGTVVIAQSGYSGYGHTVVIDHGNGLRTRYAHMQPGSIRVRVGQKVYQGQQIGNIGSTGNVTGPHLHFEVLRNGTKVNPRAYIG